jgi:hypothetical protein
MTDWQMHMPSQATVVAGSDPLLLRSRQLVLEPTAGGDLDENRALGLFLNQMQDVATQVRKND